MSRMYLLLYCQSPVLWWATADLDQENHTSWMQMQLNGGPFASLLQTVKIVSGLSFPKNLLDPLQVLPPIETTNRQIRQGRLRCIYREIPWAKKGEVI
jgi:hypothetical protein